MKTKTTFDGQLCVNSSHSAQALLKDNMCGLDHEEVWILLLTARCTVIAKEMVAMGTLCHASIDCRTVLRRALLNNAMGIILLHNHPSGDPRPSPQDIRFTSKLRDACRLFDIKLLDHIIVAGEHFYSFAEEQTHKTIQ